MLGVIRYGDMLAEQLGILWFKSKETGVLPLPLTPQGRLFLLLDTYYATPVDEGSRNLVEEVQVNLRWSGNRVYQVCKAWDKELSDALDAPRGSRIPLQDRHIEQIIAFVQGGMVFATGCDLDRKTAVLGALSRLTPAERTVAGLGRRLLLSPQDVEEVVRGLLWSSSRLVVGQDGGVARLTAKRRVWGLFERVAGKPG